jgi:hypothetical protein
VEVSFWVKVSVSVFVRLSFVIVWLTLTLEVGLSDRRSEAEAVGASPVELMLALLDFVGGQTIDDTASEKGEKRLRATTSFDENSLSLQGTSQRPFHVLQ